MGWRILKFGGSSLGDAASIGRVVAVIRSATATRPPIAVVVSALSGVTDDHVAAARAAERRDGSWESRLAELVARHREVAAAVASADEREALLGQVATLLESDLHDLLHGIHLLREATPRILDAVMSYGERLSSLLAAAALRRAGTAAAACDARRLVVTDDQFGAARVDGEASDRRIREHFAAAETLQVVTGFVAATAEGQTTTLGRGGSDSTAALLGAALGADAVELWKDVVAVMTADPRVVPEARPIERLSYDELMELSHFGAEVVHPPSLHPIKSRGIPLVIKSVLEPAAAGTRVTAVAEPDAPPVRGITAIPRVALLRLEGDGMVGVPGIAGRLFAALSREGISVILISQASSEHSICFAVVPEAVPRARRSVDREFGLERGAGLVEPLVVEEGLSVVAAVGAGMRRRPGIAGRIFAVLGAEGINVHAIAQGSSERNVSLVVDADRRGPAVAALHAALLLPERRTTRIALAGVGRVGGELLRQLAARTPALAAEGHCLRLVAVGGRRGWRVATGGLDPATAAESLVDAHPLDLAAVEAALAGDGGGVFVDCTASRDAAALYDGFLRAGVNVVTANKLRFAEPLASWQELAATGPGRLYHEATVGAGLPVVETLRGLVATGDRVRRIAAVLSGTLAYLTGELARGTAWSAAVERAHRHGYTEPDPREDLGGRDVARKLLLLARLAGCALEPEDVAVESLLPAGEGWDELDLDAFWRRLPKLDASFAARQRAAGAPLAYLATLEIGDGDGDQPRAGVALASLATDHPCAPTSSEPTTENAIAIWSARYHDAPLVVRGPGAGPAVTAGGVFADILRAAGEAAGRRPLP